MDRYRVGSWSKVGEDDLSDKEASAKELLKAKLGLKPLNNKLDSKLHVKRSATRTCSLGDMKTFTRDLQSLGLASHMGTDSSSRYRRLTLASYIPSSCDQNGNLKDMVDTKEQRHKSLEEMNTDEVCEWFKNLGLQRCIPFIKEAKLQGHQLAAIDLDILDLLQLATTEEKESLLSSIYKELHPMDTTSQNFDKLLETIGPYDVERFTAALVALSVSQKQPTEWISHPSSHLQNREDKHPEEKTIKNSNLVNLSVKAFQRKLQLRVPRDSTVAKVIDACRKILGLKEDVRLLSLNIVTSKTGEVVEELQAYKHIGELKLLGRKEFKLQLCKKTTINFSKLEKEAELSVPNESSQPVHVSEPGVAPASSQGYLLTGQNSQKEPGTEEDEIKELQKCFFSLHQEMVDLLTVHVPSTNQQGLYHSESKLLEKEQLIQHLTLAQRVLGNDSFSSRNKSLLELLKLDYQILKERASTFHLNQQQAPRSRLQDFQSTKIHNNQQSVALSQLIAPYSTSMLVIVQEAAKPGGIGFTVKQHASHGWQIVTAENSDLQPNDR
ncbi:uncharacterized protein [Narcine bancroftii]